MATEEQLTQALIAADKAGNADDARVLAQEISKMRGQKVGVGEDVVKSGASGLGGGIINTLGQIADFENPVARLLGALGVKSPRAGDILKAQAEKVTGPFYEPKTVPGQYARTIGEFAPAAFAGPEGFVPKVASVVVPAVASETAGQATKGTKYEGVARLIGALAGGGVSGVRMRAPMAPSLLGDVSPETASLFQKMKALGINIRPAQTAQSGFVKTADSELQRLPFSGYGKGDLPNNQQQIEQTTAALMKTTGSKSRVATDSAMASIKSDLGNAYQTLFGRNSITLDPATTTTLDDIAASAKEQLLEGREVPIAETVRKIKEKAAANGGVLTGQQYQSMRQTGGPIYQIAKSADPSIAFHGRQLRSALDQAFESQMPSADADLLKRTNQQYQNYKIIEPLAAKAATGQLSPQLLLSQVNKHRGSGDIQTIARGAQAFLKEPANSMTAERGAVLRSLSHPATLAAGLTGTGAIVGGASGSLASIPLALISARLLKNVVNSKAAARQLSGTPTPPLLQYTNPYPKIAP